jgi:hypothetical protein
MLPCSALAEIRGDIFYMVKNVGIKGPGGLPGGDFLHGKKCCLAVPWSVSMGTFFTWK